MVRLIWERVTLKTFKGVIDKLTSCTSNLKYLCSLRVHFHFAPEPKQACQNTRPAELYVEIRSFWYLVQFLSFIIIYIAQYTQEMLKN